MAFRDSMLLLGPRKPASFGVFLRVGLGAGLICFFLNEACAVNFDACFVRPSDLLSDHGAQA